MKIKSAREVNGAEQPVGSATLSDGKLVVDLTAGGAFAGRGGEPGHPVPDGSEGR